MGPDPGKSSASAIEVVEPTVMGMSEPEFAKLARSILIMIPHRPYEGLNASLSDSRTYWANFLTPQCAVEDHFGGFIELQRAGMVRTFLDYAKDHPEVEYLVMMDSDQPVQWDSPYRLAAWGRPIVSGVVCSYSPTRGIFACFTMKDEYNVARFPSVNITRTMPGKGLVEANSAGTGLICIKKVVLETMLEHGDVPFVIPEDMRQQCLKTGVLKWGEDTSFCHMARKHGFNTYVDLSVHSGHYKVVNVQWPTGNIDQKLDPRKWKVDNKDYLHE